MMRGIFICTLLFLMMSCTNRLEKNFAELLGHMARKNHFELNNLQYLQNQLYLNGGIRLLQSEVDYLSSIDSTIQNLDFGQLDPKETTALILNLDEFKKSLLTKESKTSELYPEDLKTPRNPFVTVLDLERDAIELSKNLLWENFLSYLDENTVVFSLPYPGHGVSNDQGKYIIGVGKPTGVLPNIRLNKTEMYRGGKSFGSGLLTQIQLDNNHNLEIEVLVPRIGLKGGYYILDLELDSKGMKVNSQ